MHLMNKTVLKDNKSFFRLKIRYFIVNTIKMERNSVRYLVCFYSVIGNTLRRVKSFQCFKVWDIDSIWKKICVVVSTKDFRF